MAADPKRRECWTVLSAIEWTTEFFRRKEMDSPRLDAEVLLAHVLGWQRIDLYTKFDSPLEKAELAAYRELIQKRAVHWPVKYLVGHTEFMSLDLRVTQDVLIPRPDTEVLVGRALEIVKPREDAPVVADLGTGSGNIAVAIAKYAERALVYASDVSARGVQLAAENARANEVDERIQFLEGDLFEPFAASGLAGKVDLLVSNPPYVAQGEYARLAPEIQTYEPSEALLAGTDGLDFFRRIAAGAGDFVKTGGAVLLEIGSTQAEDVVRMLEDSGCFDGIQVHQDLGQLPRVVEARRA